MIDIHSHIVYGVDDGSPTIKESVKMILEAEKLGINAIIATPHYNRYIYDSKNSTVNFNEIAVRVQDFGVKLYLGHEVFIKQNISDIIAADRNLRLGGSSHVLLELPFDMIPSYSGDVINRLHLESITPVIAHPERNRYFVNNFDRFMKFVENGCLLQLDAASIIGVYGSEVKNFTKKIIKLDLVHFVASDAHSAEDYIKWYKEAYKTVKKWAGEEYADKVFHNNAETILLNDIT